MTPNTELQLWEDELARAVKDLWYSEKLDDRGGIVWNEERIRWAKMKINNILDLQQHNKKGA